MPTDPNASPAFLLGVASLATILKSDIPESISKTKNCQHLFAEAIRDLGKRWVLSIDPQLFALVRLLKEIVTLLEGLSRGNARIIVLEVPIGNSLPTRLLIDLLNEKGMSTTRARIALSRNDSSKMGLTRGDLLEECLAHEGLEANDIIIYLDEWISGANFNNLLRRIDRLAAERKAFVLPAACVAPKARENERWSSYCREHDKIASKMGIDGALLRQDFPALDPTAVRSEQIFFWSEHDRLAGYRKMQFLGSLLGSIIEVADELMNNQSMLRDAHKTFLEEALRVRTFDEKTFAQLTENFAVFAGMFESAYKDFEAWKGEAGTIQLSSNIGIVEDIDLALEEMNEALVSSLEGREAKKCVQVALVWIQKFEVNARDRYHFRAHIPVITELPSPLKILSETFYRTLFSTVSTRL